MWECAHGGMLRKRNFQPGDIFPSSFSRRDSHAFRRFLSSFFYIISSHWMRRAHLHLNAFPKTSLKWGRIHPVRLTCVGFFYFLMLRETFANLFACLGGTRTFTDFTFKLRYDVLPPWLKPTLASRLLVLLDAPSRTARQVKDLWVDLCTPLYTLNRYIYIYGYRWLGIELGYSYYRRIGPHVHSRACQKWKWMFFSARLSNAWWSAVLEVKFYKYNLRQQQKCHKYFCVFFPLSRSTFVVSQLHPTPTNLCKNYIHIYI